MAKGSKVISIVCSDDSREMRRVEVGGLPKLPYLYP